MDEGLGAVLSNGSGLKILSSSAQLVLTAVNSDPRLGSRLRELAKLHQTWFVGLLYGAFIAAQALGFLILGTGRSGRGFSESILILGTLVAVACAYIAFRRASGVTALFWFLFATAQVVLLVPIALQAFDTLFAQPFVSDSTWRLLFCLYGAPIVMMLFLPTYRRSRVKYEIFLDLFQVAIVVSLIYTTFFFFPVQRMLPADALLHNLTISDLQSWLLLVAVFVRLQFAGIVSKRSLLLRLALFLLVCAVATFAGDWIELHHYTSAASWFDLGWALPPAAAAFVAITWTPSPEPESSAVPGNFIDFLGANLALVTLLVCVNLLMDRWKQQYGTTLADIAIAASLLAFAFRLALTQFGQQEEIARRKAAQIQLTVSHQKVGRLLDEARKQTSEITQISELGSLLQACTSREEVFRLIPERLRGLFPGSSGSISLLSASRKRLESGTKWGVCPVDQIFSPEQCWALRRGRTHAHRGGRYEPRCSHLFGEGPSVCIPLIANGDSFGTLSIQNDDFPSRDSSGDPEADSDSDAFDRRCQLATAVAERIALSVADLGLRESLRLQAIHDPLTGLYNRRYMQEFLDRELHSARRKRRPLAVIMIDLDYFKRYNDNFGHSAGDRALVAVCEILLRLVRVEDIACRYGGEEFVLIFPECSLRQATIRAEEIRKRLHEHRAPSGQKPADALTVSIGVAAFDETTDRVDLLLKFADDALYEAKRAGRDRVVAARPSAALPESEFTETDPATMASTEKA
jgi:diguanylate cyclase (GGDEF)-like protein